ncbi:MAG: hypothetical protein WC824_12155 [Bacteroidota bacterium]|jgi:hypothetical protein
MFNISQQTIGAMGGGCQQAVSKARNAKAWLDSKIRQWLTPPDVEEQDPVTKKPVKRSIARDLAPDDKPLKEDLKWKIKSLAIIASKRFDRLPTPKIVEGFDSRGKRLGRGRPMHRSLPELARFLNVEMVPGDTFQILFIRYLGKQTNRILKAMKSLGEKRFFWVDLWKAIDLEGFSFYPNADPVYPDGVDILGFL